MFSNFFFSLFAMFGLTTAEASNRAIAKETRVAEHKIEDIFVERWSARAMSGEELSNEEIMRLFEAARWAQSEYNNQPWIFVYAKRSTTAWDKLFDLLV